MPSQSTSLDEIGRALSVLMRRESRARVYGRLCARAGLELDPRCCWMLLRLDEHPTETVADLAGLLHAPSDAVATLAEGLAERELVEPGERVRLTPQGAAAVAKLVDARRAFLAQVVADWDPERHDELAQLLTRLAHQLAEDPAPVT